MRLWIPLGCVAALALAGAATADDKDAADGTTVRGRITKVQPDQHQFTLRTRDGKVLQLRTDDQSDLRIRRRKATLDQFKEGARVRVTYTTRDGANRVLLARERPVTLADIRRETGHALQAIKGYTFQQKDRAERQLRSVLDDLDDRIADLKERAKNEGQAEAQQHRRQIEELQRKADQVRKQLDRVKSASADSWDNVKQDVAGAVQDFQEAFEKAWSRFNK